MIRTRKTFRPCSAHSDDPDFMAAALYQAPGTAAFAPTNLTSPRS